MVAMGIIQGGDTNRFGSFGQNPGGFSEEGVGIGPMVPNFFFNGDLFGDGKVAFSHKFVDIELNGGTGGSSSS